MSGRCRSFAGFFWAGLAITVVAAYLNVLPTTAQSSQSPPPAQGMPGMGMNPGPHGDHNPKHGGLFFMATDYHHHLEGKLVAPGRFYVWLYDEYTKPLNTEQLKQAKGTVEWGADAKAPRTPIVLAQDGQRLEALPSGPLKLPITLTLRIVFPGDPRNSKAELFTFPIVRFSPDEAAPQQTPGDMNSMDHSGSGHTSVAPGDKSADTLERHPAH